MIVTRDFVNKRLQEQQFEINKFICRHWKQRVTTERKLELMTSAFKQRDYFVSLLEVMDENHTDFVIF